MNIRHNAIATMPDDPDVEINKDEWNDNHFFDIDANMEMNGNSLTEVEAISFLTTANPSHIEGQIHWDDNDKTLELDTEITGTHIQVGQETVLRATNKTGVSIPNGSVVYINGAQGNRPTIALADADTEATSSKVIGITTNIISNNNTGYVTCHGIIRDLNTNSFNEGDLLWLSDTAGTFTSTRPPAPKHAVYLGIVLVKHVTEGQIFIRPNNGFEINELHDVLLSSLADKQLLYWDNTASVWKNSLGLLWDENTDILSTETIQTNNIVISKILGNGIKVDTTTPTFGWRDLIGDIHVHAISANDPTFSVYRGNVKQFSFSNAIMNEVYINFHMPHDYVPGSHLYIHPHWSQIVVDSGGTAGAPGNVKWSFEVSYAKGHNQAAFSTPITTSVIQTASTVQYQHMLPEVQLSATTPSASQLDSDDLEIDGLLLIRVFRDPTDLADTLNQVPFLHYVDIHYQSTGIPTKQKAPNFYV